MVQKFSPKSKEDSVTIRMDIAVDLPEEMAEQLEQLGLYEFEQCVYDSKARCVKASVSTTLYRKGA